MWLLGKGIVMKTKRGFTLLEILIVVVIIGILAGLAIPKFARTIEAAKGKEALVNLETIRTAERMYYLDYNAYTLINSSLIPSYLPENPNTNPNRNWDYGVGIALQQITAFRNAGRYEDSTIQIYFNGDFVVGTNWPWPPP